MNSRLLTDYSQVRELIIEWNRLEDFDTVGKMQADYSQWTSVALEKDDQLRGRHGAGKEAGKETTTQANETENDTGRIRWE